MGSCKIEVNFVFKYQMNEINYLRKIFQLIFSVFEEDPHSISLILRESFVKKKKKKVYSLTKINKC